jgi:nitrate/nitrite transporter NarK
MVAWAWHSDLTGERTWHVAGAWLLVSAGMAACSVIGLGHPALTMVALTCAITGTWAIQPTFWGVPTAMLTGTAAAGGFAMINSVGNLGGWLGPTVYGMIRDATGSDSTALLCLALAPIVAALAVITAGQDRRLERIPPRV